MLHAIFTLPLEKMFRVIKCNLKKRAKETKQRDSSIVLYLTVFVLVETSFLQKRHHSKISAVQEKTQRRSFGFYS